MQARSLDCLLVYGTGVFFGSDPGSPNVMYLAGYPPAIAGYLVFPRVGDPTLVLFVSGHLANAKDLSVVKDIRTGRDIAAVAVTRIQELGLGSGRIGLVGNFGWTRASVPVEHYQTFTQALPGASFENVTDWYEGRRLIKSREEVDLLERAAAICDGGQEYARELMRPGALDIDIQNEVQAYVHRKGARTTFGHVQPTPMANPSMAYPSFYPIGRAFQTGDAVMTEFTAGLGGYLAKLFVTLFLGAPTPAYREMFELAADTYHALHERVEPGMRVTDVDQFMSARVSDTAYELGYMFAGWSNYNTPPAVNPRSGDWELELTLSPGICFSVVGWTRTPDRSAGVWVGDTSIMTDSGLRNLHAYPVDDLSHATL
jgi:Xaa-Pro aminopeptidase